MGKGKILRSQFKKEQIQCSESELNIQIQDQEPQNSWENGNEMGLLVNFDIKGETTFW